MKIVDSTLSTCKLGDEVRVTSDSYDMADADIGVRYFQFMPESDGEYAWDCYLPNPGFEDNDDMKQEREIEILNTSFNNSDKGMLTLTIHQPAGSVGSRIIIGNRGGACSDFVLPCGASVKLLSVKGNAQHPKRWYWQVTMTVGEVAS